MPSERYWLHDLWLIDGTGAEPRRTALLLGDGRIEGILPDGEAPPPNAVAMSLEGAHVLPGLINAHSHLFRERSPHYLLAPETAVPTIASALENARRALARGVTTTRDCGAPNGWDLQLRDAVAAGLLPGPRIVACGRPITRTGGHFHFLGREADGPDEVRKAVREQLKAGVDAVKIMCTGGYGTPDSDSLAATYTEEEIRAAVDEAHTAGRRILAHTVAREGIRRALRAGVDSVEHCSMLDEETVDLLGQKGSYLVPTISTTARMARHGREWGRPDHAVQGARQFLPFAEGALARAVAARLPIAVGTDTWGEMVLEMELLVSAGMTPLQAITAATAKGADLLGRTDLGMVAPGRRADLVVVRGDPLRRLEILRNPAVVFQEGRIVFRTGTQGKQGEPGGT